MGGSLSKGDYKLLQKVVVTDRDEGDADEGEVEWGEPPLIVQRSACR